MMLINVIREIEHLFSYQLPVIKNYLILSYFHYDTTAYRHTKSNNVIIIMNMILKMRNYTYAVKLLAIQMDF